MSADFDVIVFSNETKRNTQRKVEQAVSDHGEIKLGEPEIAVIPVREKIGIKAKSR